MLARHRAVTAPSRGPAMIGPSRTRSSYIKSGRGAKTHARRMSGMRPVIGVTSQVTRSWPPDHVCDRAPDSVKLGAEIGGFRAHGEREIAKIGHLTLDQETEGSNPSSPAKPRHLVATAGPTSTGCGSLGNPSSRAGCLAPIPQSGDPYARLAAPRLQLAGHLTRQSDGHLTRPSRWLPDSVLAR
jgi:hypothetical protein